MKTQIKKLTASFLTALMLVTVIPISEAAVNAADHDQELREFVTRLYSVCLKRDPDEGGLEYWVDELKTKKETGVACASGFIFSPELQEKDYSNEDYAKVMYDAFFGREADSDGLSYWTQKMSDGMTRQEVFTGFANSQEFFDLCESFDIVAGTFIPGFDPSKVSSTNFFAERLYNVVLGRKCDKDGMMYWTTELLNGRISGTAAAYGFFFSPEYADSKKHYSEYVNDLYNALMGREADEDGRSYWVNAINTGSTKEQVFNGFAMSPEFSSICSNYGILQGTTISEENDTTYTLLPDDDSSVTTTPKPTKAPADETKAPTTKPSNSKATPTTKPVTNTTTTKPTTDPSATKTPAATSAPAASPTPDPGIKVVPVDENLQIKNSTIRIMNGCSEKILFTDSKNATVAVEGATFTSDNEDVAYVCPDGTVIGLSVGSAVVTVKYGNSSSCVYVSVDKYVSNITSIPNSLTPQQFGAVGDGKHDDTQAFRDMFAYSASVGYTVSLGWKHCQAIYIPSGTYLITGPIIDKDLKTPNGTPLNYCMFEVTGSGRESTTLRFSGDVMFNARNNDNRTIFAFTTFRDIGFVGNDNNTFMTMTAVEKDGTQRMQFFSCLFEHFHNVAYCDHSTIMLSEITFSYCKIANCGTDSNRCQLFVLDDPQAVNWRFDYTDIESFNGDGFYFKTGTGVTLNGGSIIPGKNGCVFNFDINGNSQQAGLGPGNAAQVLAIGARFEIHAGKTLLKTNSNSMQYPKVTFRNCNVNASDSNNLSDVWFVVRGGMDVLFDNCFNCTFSRFDVDCSQHTGYIKPKVKFVNCPDINVKSIVNKSTVKTITGGRCTNNLHITIDDQYDFYLADGGYYHTTDGLKECRQIVDINSDNDTRYEYTEIMNGKTLTPYQYGYVEYVEITVPANEKYKNTPVTVALYDGTKKISDTVTINFGTSQTYKLYVNGSDSNKYVDDLKIKFGNSNSKNPFVNMNITVVKK